MVRSHSFSTFIKWLRSNGLGMVLTAGIFLLPLISATGGFLENEFGRLMVFYGIGVVGLGVVMLTGQALIRPNWRSWGVIAALGFIGTYGVASGLGLSSQDSVIGRYGLWIYSLMSVSMYGLWFYLWVLWGSIKKNDSDNQWQLALLVPAFLLSGMALSQKLPHSLWDFYNSERSMATFRQPIQAGFYFSLIIILAGAWWQTAKDNLVRQVSFIALAGSSLALAATQSRSSWIALAGVLGIFSLWKIIHRWQFPKNLSFRAGWLAVLLIGLLCLPLIYRRSESVFTGPSQRSSYHIRLLEWQTGLNIWWDHPWLGIGPENIDLIYPQYRSQEMNQVPEEWQWRTVTLRNTWLELLATTGVFGLLTFLAIGVYLLFYFVRGKDSQWLGLWLGFFYLHAGLYSVSLVVLAVFLAVVGYYLGKTQTATASFKVGIPLRWVMVGLCSAALYLIGRVFWAEIIAFRALSFIEQQPNQSLILMERVVQLNPWFDKNLRQLLLAEVETILQNQVVMDQRPRLIERYHQHLLQLETRNHRDLENLKSLSSGYMRLAGFTGKPEYYTQAVQWGLVLIQTDPTSPGSWDTLALVYLDKKDYLAAINAYHHILMTLKPDYPYAYFHLGETYRQMGMPGNAIGYYEEALRLGFEGAEMELEETHLEINTSSKE